jgi:hypothetical protein
MTTEQRVAVYGGFDRLTPRQRRRAAKKDRQAKQRPAAYVQTSSDRWAFLDARYSG